MKMPWWGLLGTAVIFIGSATNVICWILGFPAAMWTWVLYTALLALTTFLSLLNQAAIRGRQRAAQLAAQEPVIIIRPDQVIDRPWPDDDGYRYGG